MATQQLLCDVILRDGSTLRLRAPPAGGSRGHQGLLRRALAGESLYAVARLRAHGHRGALHDGGRRRRPRALIGRHRDRVVATAGYDRLREPGVAEVAFAVADDFRGRGTATRMLELLAAIAAAQGIHRFDTEVTADNRAAGRFQRSGLCGEAHRREQRGDRIARHHPD